MATKQLAHREQMAPLGPGFRPCLSPEVGAAPPGNPPGGGRDRATAAHRTNEGGTPR